MQSKLPNDTVTNLDDTVEVVRSAWRNSGCPLCIIVIGADRTLNHEVADRLYRSVPGLTPIFGTSFGTCRRRIRQHLRDEDEIIVEFSAPLLGAELVTEVLHLDVIRHFGAKSIVVVHVIPAQVENVSIRNAINTFTAVLDNTSVSAEADQIITFWAAENRS